MRTNIAIAAFLGVIFLSFFSPNTSALVADENICGDVEIVFARGSGQDIAEDDSARFQKQIKERIKPPIDVNFYELGAEEYDGNKYEAVDVSDVGNGNAIGAKTSSGYAFDYGDSVKGGVAELKDYLTKRHQKCPDAQIVLGGYSQGAQVIGQSLSSHSAPVQNKIVFSALFADPKLYLPEGKGIIPDACRGKNFSTWRRDIGNCHTDNGALGARVPYLSNTMSAKTGLWCNANDFVCGSAKVVWDSEGHSKYKDEGGAIDKAALEIAEIVKARLPEEDAAAVDVSMPDSNIGTAGIDVAFVLDTTGSMSLQIESSKQFIRDYAHRIKKMNGRMSLTVYRDLGDDYTAKIVSNLQESPDELLAQLDIAEAGGGDDYPEATLHALTTTFNGLNWKNGATKAAVVVTDAPFHNPDMVDGSTIESVAKRSLEIDPVNVYPVIPEYLKGDYTNLAEKTSGQVVVDSGDTSTALDKVLTKLERRPTALLKNLNYLAKPGQSITFDASDSYVVDADITKYDWDFNGDGEFDRTTAEPAVDYTYPLEFAGTMQVRLTASNGTIANASATVKIASEIERTRPAAPTNLKVEVLSTKDQKSTVKFSWQPADSLASKWIISVNGVSLGYLPASRTSLEITDVERQAAVEFSVAGANSSDEIGDSSQTTLDKYQAPPAKLSWWQIFLAWLRDKVARFGWFS